MAWVKLDDGFFNNQKIVSVSKDAKLIYLAGLCYSGSTLSDGFIPRNAVTILAAQSDVRAAGKATNELVTARLWVPIEGGFQVHDYLEHNESSQNVRAKQAAARERMQRSRSQNVRANSTRTSREVHEPDTDIDTDTELTPTDVGVGGASAPATPDAKPEKKPKAKRATQIPKTWMPADSTRKWAAGEGFTDEQVDGQILRFVDHWRGKGEARKDWDATFRNWMRNAREWGHFSNAAQPRPQTRDQAADMIAEAQREREKYEQARGAGSSGDSEFRLAGETATRNHQTGVLLDISRRTG